ncbi:DHA1 family purine ribonucleoside efflux pump-like MFS transporter/DHA1 family bicyclomycin/chloramphenicol resistance-like MFS transporter [Pararhizobium capsulatum DSM 1112]|uniref:Bcr/CflA family efflux transporter n=1 Tax=Pararhizobium capsulatum DSM 1112 TaxID=1121113 RepID=A0ABU0BIG6_9HYPH|nr:multidrug effflux MFS transporter [Pararhizobium capsulatum]MDQ0318044.1 DHA1 family purine ribonucleoside efflux pump-like MFS transporter/DHA1 family bicyclomycin/chloramphenicol resistance-like MFS transporter [Pararhizobium capsulatum DSM 1112]
MSERRTSILGALLATLGPISMSIYTPAMPELVEAFSSTESMIKLTLSVYFGGFSVAQLVSGPMSDAFGRKTATLAFVGINLLGSLICILAPSVEWLLAGRLIQGIGASVGITVARAIVRDQFTGTEASRIMNLIGIMLAIGPAMAPTIGGLALAAFGWHSIFLVLIGFGLLTASAVLIFMRETTVADRALARPRRLLAAYWSLLKDGRFIAAALVLGGSVGALYAQATMLPFILIERVGLTPTAFGIGMLMQSGSYFFGSVCLRLTAEKLGGEGSVRAGLAMLATGGLLIALSVQIVTPSYLSVMLPVAFLSFGIAFLTPHMTTAALQSFPHIAGSASAMMGFIQMAGGFLGGLAAAWMGTPFAAFGIIIPTMALIPVLSYLRFVQLTRRAVVG